MRQQARALQGLGRGGGFFERNSAEPVDRKEELIAEAKGGLDVYGRRRGAATSGVQESVQTPSAGPRNSLTTVGSLPSKADRQKAALERLRNPVMKKKDMSPPRTRVYREKTSRSRSRDKKKDQRRGYITSLELGVGTEATEAVGLFPSGQAQLAKLPAGELK